MSIILMIVGAAVVYSFLRTFYLRNWNKKLDTTIKFSVSDAVCGDTFEMIEEVTNAKSMPLPFIHLKFQASTELEFKDGEENSKVSDATYRDDVFSLLMNQKITRRIPVSCSMRGVYSLNNLELVFTGLFMNDIGINRKDTRASVTIYPDPYSMEDIDVLYSKVLGLAERNSLINPDPFAFRQIREYDTSDPMNTINWKASARTGELMVNQFNETTCQEVYIMLNLEPEGVLVYERLSEASISIAAGLSQILIDNGMAVGLISNGKDYESGENAFCYAGSEQEHLKDINTALARIDLSKGQDDYCTYISELTDGFNRRITESDGHDAMYIIISQNSRDEVQIMANNLTGEGSCMFIVPHFRDMAVNMYEFDGEVLEWEVTHNARG